MKISSYFNVQSIKSHWSRLDDLSYCVKAFFWVEFVVFCPDAPFLGSFTQCTLLFIDLVPHHCRRNVSAKIFNSLNKPVCYVIRPQDREVERTSPTIIGYSAGDGVSLRTRYFCKSFLSVFLLRQVVKVKLMFVPPCLCHKIMFEIINIQFTQTARQQVLSFTCISWHDGNQTPMYIKN